MALSGWLSNDSKVKEFEDLTFGRVESEISTRSTRSPTKVNASSLVKALSGFSRRVSTASQESAEVPRGDSLGKTKAASLATAFSSLRRKSLVTSPDKKPSSSATCQGLDAAKYNKTADEANLFVASNSANGYFNTFLEEVKENGIVSSIFMETCELLCAGGLNLAEIARALDLVRKTVLTEAWNNSRRQNDKLEQDNRHYAEELAQTEALLQEKIAEVEGAQAEVDNMSQLLRTQGNALRAEFTAKQTEFESKLRAEMQVKLREVEAARANQERLSKELVETRQMLKTEKQKLNQWSKNTASMASAVDQLVNRGKESIKLENNSTSQISAFLAMCPKHLATSDQALALVESSRQVHIQHKNINNHVSDLVAALRAMKDVADGSIEHSSPDQAGSRHSNVRLSSNGQGAEQRNSRDIGHCSDGEEEARTRRSDSHRSKHRSSTNDHLPEQLNSPDGEEEARTRRSDSHRSKHRSSTNDHFPEQANNHDSYQYSDGEDSETEDRRDDVDHGKKSGTRHRRKKLTTSKSTLRKPKYECEHSSEHLESRDIEQFSDGDDSDTLEDKREDRKGGTRHRRKKHTHGHGPSSGHDADSAICLPEGRRGSSTRKKTSEGIDYPSEQPSSRDDDKHSDGDDSETETLKGRQGSTRHRRKKHTQVGHETSPNRRGSGSTNRQYKSEGAQHGDSSEKRKSAGRYESS